MNINFPLMKNNISREDLDLVIEYLKQEDPILTQSKNVEEFEKKWSDWLGVKYSVFVNSGSSSNLITIAILKQLYGTGEIIVPSLTWVSDIASVLQNGFKPVFVDIKFNNLSIDEDKIINKINSNTKAIFITHAQGFCGLSDKLLKIIKEKSIVLIEDVCESHGASFRNKKLGTYGLMSNFSFYYAHHMSTIEGGMVCTNDENIYQMLKIFRGHGMVRESTNESLIEKYTYENPSLNSKFIFAYPAYNVRNNEIGAIIGKNQINNLDKNILLRNENHSIFLEKINNKNFIIDFNLSGQSNYAFNLIVKNPDKLFVQKLIKKMDNFGVEYRRGSAGGGNQLRQPYLLDLFPKNYFKKFPITEHVHFYGFYLGNYPTLKREKIIDLCKIINSV